MATCLTHSVPVAKCAQDTDDYEISFLKDAGLEVLMLARDELVVDLALGRQQRRVKLDYSGGAGVAVQRRR